MNLYKPPKPDLELERDGLRFRKMANLIERGEWASGPIIIGEATEYLWSDDLHDLRAKVDRATAEPKRYRGED